MFSTSRVFSCNAPIGRSPLVEGHIVWVIPMAKNIHTPYYCHFGQFINGRHAQVILNDKHSKSALTPGDLHGHFIIVITGDSLKGSLDPKIFVSESIIPRRYLWNTKSICKELQCQKQLLKSWRSSRF